MSQENWILAVPSVLGPARPKSKKFLGMFPCCTDLYLKKTYFAWVQVFLGQSCKYFFSSNRIDAMQQYRSVHLLRHRSSPGFWGLSAVAHLLWERCECRRQQGRWKLDREQMWHLKEWRGKCQTQVWKCFNDWKKKLQKASSVVKICRRSAREVVMFRMYRAQSN